MAAPTRARVSTTMAETTATFVRIVRAEVGGFAPRRRRGSVTILSNRSPNGCLACGATGVDPCTTPDGKALSYHHHARTSDGGQWCGDCPNCSPAKGHCGCCPRSVRL